MTEGNDFAAAYGKGKREKSEIMPRWTETNCLRYNRAHARTLATRESHTRTITGLCLLPVLRHKSPFRAKGTFRDREGRDIMLQDVIEASAVIEVK